MKDAGDGQEPRLEESDVCLSYLGDVFPSWMSPLPSRAMSSLLLALVIMRSQLVLYDTMQYILYGITG